MELFLEEGKKFQIMRKRLKRAHTRTDNEHINSLWRGGFWLQILKHSGSFVGTGDLISGGYQLPGSRPTPCNSSSVGVARSTAGARQSCHHYPPSIFVPCYLKQLQLCFLHFHIFKTHALKVCIPAGITLYGQ